MEYLLTFIASLYLRNPSYREKLSAPLERETKIKLSMLSESKALYNSEVSRAIKAGTIKKGMCHEELHKIVKAKSITFKANKDFIIKQEINSLLDTAKLLGQRRWSLFSIPEDKTYEFITSDNPFTLLPPERTNNIPVGIGTEETKILIPINKRSALMGVLDNREDSSEVADEALVGVTNSLVINNSNKVFYTSKKLITLSDGKSIWKHNIEVISSNGKQYTD